MEQEDLVVSNTSSRTGEMSMDETEEESATLHVSVSSALESRGRNNVVREGMSRSEVEEKKDTLQNDRGGGVKRKTVWLHILRHELP